MDFFRDFVVDLMTSSVSYGQIYVVFFFSLALSSILVMDNARSADMRENWKLFICLVGTNNRWFSNRSVNNETRAQHRPICRWRPNVNRFSSYIFFFCNGKLIDILENGINIRSLSKFTNDYFDFCYLMCTTSAATAVLFPIHPAQSPVYTHAVDLAQHALNFSFEFLVFLR